MKKMHKVVGYKSGDDFDPHGNKMDFCPECGAILRKSQYGTDDECPECGAFIEWVDEQGE